MMNDTAVGEVNLDPGDLSDLDAEDGEINDLEEGELRSDGDDSDPINTLEKSETTNSQSSTYSKIISLKPDRPTFQGIRASDRLSSAGVCRFYLRDLCTWGERCKYFHPSEAEMSHYIEKNRYQRNSSTTSSSAVRNDYSSHQPNGIVGKPVPLRSVNVGSVITSDSSSHASSEIKKIREDSKDYSCKISDENNDSSSSEKHSKKSGGSTLRSLFERTDLDFSNKKSVEKPKNGRHSRSASSSSSGSYRRNDRRGRDHFTHRHNNDNDRRHYNNRRRIDIEKFFKVNEEDAPAAYRNNSEKMRNNEKMRRVSSSSSSSSRSLSSNSGSRNNSKSRRRCKRRHRKSRESSADSKNKPKHRRSMEEKRKPMPTVVSPRRSHSPVIEPISSDDSEADVNGDVELKQDSSLPKLTTSQAPNSTLSMAKVSASEKVCADGNNEDEEKKRKRLELLNQLKTVEEAIAKKQKKVNGIV